MGQLRLIADCIDELEQDIDQGVTVDRQQIATAVKRLQSLLARSSISINEIVPIQPLPGEPTQRLSKRLQL
ncbi:hypothetical protein [Neptuniibacter sp. QD48_11]|uniref:hypothetical protein n=1 Tax=Neptuniibacter sp. QD48_11 TaxID=3398211 RepID=UPI0039F55CD8